MKDIRSCCDCGWSEDEVQRHGDMLVDCVGCVDLVCTDCAEVVNDEESGEELHLCQSCYMRELEKLVVRS